MKWRVYAFYAAMILLGILMDFFMNGICKIIWFLIYTPTYMVVAHTLYERMAKGRWRANAKGGAVLIVVAALVSHVLTMGRERSVEYSMHIVSESPLTLGSSEWPQQLIVNSEKLQQYIKDHPLDAQNISVKIWERTNYGCIDLSKVQSVAGIDLQEDTSSNWTLKFPHDLSVTKGPEMEDRHLPWCLLPVFYKK